MTNPRTRYHRAKQDNGRGWMLIRLDELGAGWSTTALVVEVDLTDVASQQRLLELRAAEVLEPDFPIAMVNQQIIDAGGNPDEIGRRGEDHVRSLLAKRRGSKS